MAARTHESVTNFRVQYVRRHVHLARATEARYRGSQQTRDLTCNRRGGGGGGEKGGFRLAQEVGTFLHRGLYIEAFCQKFYDVRTT